MNFSVTVYEHAAALIGRSPWDVSRDAGLVYLAHFKAHQLYGHSPIVVGIDIYNIEAEAYGAVVEEPDENGIPAITKPICASVSELKHLDMFDPESAGRIPMLIEVGTELKRRLPGADVRIPVSGPFSIAGNLVGFETLLLESISNPGTTLATLNHLAEGQVNFCRELHRNGLGMALFESGAAPPLVSPDLFSEVVLPPLRILVQRASEITGRPAPLIIGGNTLPILESMLETGTDYLICPAETDQSAFMNRIDNQPGITVRVNMNPTILAAGSWPDIREEADRILDLIGDRENTFLGTGPLPYETQPENIIRLRDYVDSDT